MGGLAETVALYLPHSVIGPLEDQKSTERPQAETRALRMILRLLRETPTKTHPFFAT